MSEPSTPSSSQPQWSKEIDLLQQRIGDLIQLCETLRGENRLLRGRLQQVEDQRDRLQEKNQDAVKSVESILATVQILEQQS